MIYYQDGDALKIAELYRDQKVIIPHIVNNIDKFGSGFAKALMNKWPNVKKEYHMLKEYQVLGEILAVDVSENIKVINMCAQNGVISVVNKTPIHYHALEICLEKIQKQYPSELIVCPKFGSGLAGGNWNTIVSLINKYWNRPVVVCSLEGK
jgi:hypothetical protein